MLKLLEYCYFDQRRWWFAGRVYEALTILPPGKRRSAD